jgi:hypothetical protein
MFGFIQYVLSSPKSSDIFLINDSYSRSSKKEAFQRFTTTKINEAEIKIYIYR